MAPVQKPIRKERLWKRSTWYRILKLFWTGPNADEGDKTALFHLKSPMVSA